MSITETLINYMYSLKAKGITYSMVGSRTGRDGTGDCSGTIYAGLVAAGLPTLQYPFSTESEHSYLLNNGYELIAYNKDWTAKRGDIFIWGEKGSSNGAGGHTGVFIDADNIIHTNYGYNGTTVNNYNTIYNYNLPNGVYVYRLKNQNQAAKPSAPTTTNDGWTKESATFVCGERLPLSKDIDPNSAAVAWLNKGDTVKYDAYKIANGYVWIRQPRNSGGYYYMAVGVAQNGKNVNPFGTFK